MPQSAQAREIVGFAGNYSSGTIVVKTNERALYYVLGNGKALRYPVGVGRAGKQWTGTAMINGKQLRPAWSPPAEVKRDKPSLPNVIPGGSPSNPMGAAAMTLSGGGIRHPRHQSAQLDRRLRVLRLHPHVQRGCPRSVQPRGLGNDGCRDALKSTADGGGRQLSVLRRLSPGFLIRTYSAPSPPWPTWAGSKPTT